MLLGPADDTMAKSIASYAALPHVSLMQVRTPTTTTRQSYAGNNAYQIVSESHHVYVFSCVDVLLAALKQ